MTQRSQWIKGKAETQDLIKYKLQAKETVNNFRDSCQEVRRCLPTVSDSGLISRIYKDLKKFSNN